MTSFDPEKITFFAKTDARGQASTFGIKAKDRQRHMYIVGKTGMGKSTLLENMAAQDMQNGEGMAFIDPHGSAAETLLDYVPEHRIDDVVYFAPFDLNHPVSFNVMEDVGPDKRHLVVSGLMSTFKKIWVDAWSARMEYILTNALLALIEYPDTTLLSVNRLFIDETYRNRVVDYVKDPAVKAYWTEEFANYTERFAAEALPAIQNKIGQFTGNPLIRNIIGQPHSSFNIRDIMDQKKILIMNLSKGLIGETNANLLGSMLTTRIYLAAMSRADLPVEEMRVQPNFYFYVDEFQSFANSTFANILSEARKYHLNLIIAHQYIAQMEEEVRDAVFGNVGTTISFRVGPFDGEVLETVFAPQFTATDLVNLGFAQIYLTLMIDGIGSQPFSAETLPPVQRPLKSSRNQVVTRSRELYASDRDKVEKIVDELHMPDVTVTDKKKNNKSKGKNNNSKKKDFPPKKVNSGPQTSEELKAILAHVADKNGGKKKEITAESEENGKNLDQVKETTNLAVNPSKEDQKEKDKREYQEGLKAELARFKNLEEGSKKAVEEEKVEKEKPAQPDSTQTREPSPKTLKKVYATLVTDEDDSSESVKELRMQKEEIVVKESDVANEEFKTVERFKDIEFDKKEKNHQQSNKNNKNSQHKKTKKRNNQNTSRNQLKEALAGVLEETKRKEAYKVPAFSEAEDNSQEGTPTVRVVKTVSEELVKAEPDKEVPIVQLDTDDPLDPRKIKKMLQTSKHEKSPMNT